LALNTTGFSGYRVITNSVPLVGTADPHATVALSEGTTVLATTTANASGQWSYSLTGLPEGNHVITATEANAGSASMAFTFAQNTAVFVQNMAQCGMIKNLGSR